MAHTASTEQCQYCNILGKGTKVEVWSEEDGFRNAWFPAEILQPPLSAHSPSGRKLKKTATAVVRYDHMLSTDGLGGPLVERINTSFIRPVPPLDSSPDSPLEPNEVVDAFCRDTWWTGFVVRVVGDTYTVAFKNPLDLQEFRRSDLRLHWDWVESKWVRPDKEDTTGLIYIPGTEVEVNRHHESPCHAWLQAVVIGKVESTSFLVKYKSSDSGDESPQQETVESEQIRPCPPEMEVENFDLLEKVNVFRNSCWWLGVITKILEGKRYVVTLRHKKAMEFSHSELRPHLEWIDGQWVARSKVVLPTSNSQKQIRQTLDQSSGTLDDTEKETPCLSNKQDNKKVLSPHVDESPYLGGSNMENENHISSGDKLVEVTQNGDDKQQEVGEMESQAVIPAKKRGRRRKSHESSGSILDDTEKERPCSGNKQGNQEELSPCVEKSLYLGSSNLVIENHISSCEPAEAIPNGDDKINEQQEVGETESQAVTSVKKRGRRRKYDESSGSVLADTEKEKSCSGNKQGNQKNQKKLSPCVEKLAYLGSSNMEKESHISSGDKPAEVTPNGYDKKTRQEETGEAENQAVVSAKKRGRPRKSRESSGSTLDETEKERPCSSKKQDNQEELIPCVEKSPCFRNSNMEKENHISSGGKPVEVIGNGDDKKTRQEVAGETENQAVTSAKKRGRQRKSRESSGSALDDTEKERPCSSKKLDNKKELIACVEKLPYFRNSNMEKENHISSGGKSVGLIQNGDDKKIEQEESGETENAAVLSAKKRGRQRKSYESSGSTLDDTEKERPSSCDKVDNQKKLSSCVEKSTSVGSLNVEKENDISNGDKPVEVIQDGDDKKTKQQEAGETENQTVISSKKRGRPKKSEPNNSCPIKRRRGAPSGLKIKESQPSSIVEGTFIKVADTKHVEAMTEELEVCCGISEDFEGVKSTRVENSRQLPTVNEQTGHVETSSEITENGEHPELQVANSQAVVAGEELCEVSGFAADCTTAKSKSPLTTEVLLTDTLEKDGTTAISPLPIIVSSNDQASLMPVEDRHAPINVGESGIIVRTNVQNFPFVKSYPIWQTIESMEVFKILPQNPHFQPLMNYKEVKREGLAIGHMMNFASLVEMIFKLQENDSREDFESILEELDELEEFGFDVEVVRCRVSKLLRAKFLLANFMDKLKGVEIEIQECTDAKTKIDGDVADIDKELKRLEEKRAVLMSESQDTDSKLEKLNSEARVIDEGISSTRESFRSLVETPW